MRYLITTREGYFPFLTNFFDLKNHFDNNIEMIVYDLAVCKYTTDGKTWIDIGVDHL